MRVHSLRKIAAVKLFRRQGKSIQELMKEFNIPKTTVWHHVHDIRLSLDQIQRIKTRQGGSRIRRQKQLGRAREEAKKIVGGVNITKTAPLLLACLYWAEGNKKGFVFTNTDENMIRLFLKILRSHFGVKNNDIIATIRVGKSMNQEEALLHWKRTTSVSIKNIRLNVNSAYNRSKAKHGICRITIRRGGYLSKVVNCVNEELTSKAESSIFE